MTGRLVVTAAAAFFFLCGLIFPQTGAIGPPLERDHFRYYFDDPGLVELADDVLPAVRTDLKRRLEDTLTYRPRVFIVDDRQRFQELIAGGFPDWGAAAAIPHRKMIVIKSPRAFSVNKPLDELLAHEYAHLALAHRTGFNHAPRWFSEGLSMLVSTEWGWGDNLAVSKAAIFGQLIPLDSIESLNRFNENQAHVAYAQSYLTVRYFYDQYTAHMVNIFLDSIREGASIDQALIASTGSTQEQFNDEVHQYIVQHYNITTIFMDTMFLWLGLALVVLIAVFVRFRKRRQYYKRREQEERFQSTDFDYGDPDRPEQIDDEDEPWRR